MGRVIFLVGIGGMLGSLARYFTATGVARILPASFPYGTFAVNVFGCLIIGLIYGLSARSNFLSPDWRLFLATGFCGGFTTFSSFSYEFVALLQNGDALTGASYIFLSMFAGFAATAAGILVTRAF